MKKPKKAWKPKSAAAQIAAHKKSVEATRKRDAHPAEAKAKAVKAARATLAAARKESVKVRKWSPDGDVALCAARAVAESLRIALSVPVSDEDVLGLYWSTASDSEAGASILATLRAARDVFERGAHFIDLSLDIGIGHQVLLPVPDQADGRIPAAQADSAWPSPQFAPWPHSPAGRALALASHHHPVIIGLDLPYGEPHAVVAHDGLWWSWGEPYQPSDFPGAVIEEAWAVTW